MRTRSIILCYRKIIDVNAAKPWDKLVFEDSYTEFKLQAQNFSHGTAYTSYADLIRNIPNAQQLPGLVTPAISNYIRQLNDITPDILNNIGRRFLRFNQFKFELINSDINDKSKHQISVNFYSDPLLWHETIANFLLVSTEKENDLESENLEILTNLFQLQPYLTIYSIKNNS